MKPNEEEVGTARRISEMLARDPEWQRQMAESEDLLRRAAAGDPEAIEKLGPPISAAELRERLEQEMSPKPAKGVCSVCGRVFRLNKDGTLHVHGSGLRGTWPPMNCSGSRELPE